MSMMTQRITRLPRDDRSLADFRAFTRETILDIPLPAEMAAEIVDAVDEVVSGFLREARDQPGEIELSIDVDDVRLKVIVTDTNTDCQRSVATDSGELSRWMERERDNAPRMARSREVMDELRYVYRKGFENRIEMLRFLHDAE